jgi:hypothetical protein
MQSPTRDFNTILSLQSLDRELAFECEVLVVHCVSESYGSSIRTHSARRAFSGAWTYMQAQSLVRLAATVFRWRETIIALHEAGGSSFYSPEDALAVLDRVGSNSRELTFNIIRQAFSALVNGCGPLRGATLHGPTIPLRSATPAMARLMKLIDERNALELRDAVTAAAAEIVDDGSIEALEGMCNCLVARNIYMDIL